MDSLLIISLMLAIEVVGFVYYAARSRFSLQGFAAINMILALFLSRKLVDLGGSVTTVGSVWYTAVLAAQVHIKLFYGRKAAIDSALMLVSTSALFLALVLTASMVPGVTGNEVVTEALRRWSFAAQYTVPASFLGYAVAQSILLSVIGIGRKFATVSALVAMAVAQVADSVVYFPAAFRNLSVDDLTTFTLSGIKLKMAATLFLWAVAVIDWRLVFSKTHQRATYAVQSARD